ncbi:MAG: hypothetical protein GY754_42505 [bacterium]|nr:hypothetical protein [bacterium]
MKKYKLRLSCFLLTVLFCGLSAANARDIDLDKMYIKTDSSLYKQLLRKKTGLYYAINSQYIDKNVIFAGWVQRNTVVYIQEFSGTNVVYTYNLSRKRRSEVTRLGGTITTVRVSPNGKYVFIKRLVIKSDGYPVGETILLNIRSRTFKLSTTPYPFLDFSVTPGGNSILFENGKGIVELFPESGIKRLVKDRSFYADIYGSGSPAIAWLSPNKTKLLIVHGSGGSYRAKVIVGDSGSLVSGITSVEEVDWINNNEFVFRKGYPGNFSVHLFNTKTGSDKKLLSHSLNTNIRLSRYPQLISFLNNQVIQVYDIRNESLFNTGLEGEDILFSPGGSKFTSLLFKRLFITDIDSIKKNRLTIKRSSKKILNLYEILLSNKSYWDNEYSAEYIRKKIRVYKKLVGE